MLLFLPKYPLFLNQIRPHDKNSYSSSLTVLLSKEAKALKDHDRNANITGNISDSSEKKRAGDG